MAETLCGSDPLLAHFGRIDIYLFDQLLKGRITPEMRILDAGCGQGRNSVYLMRCGADVFGVDVDPNQIAQIRKLAAEVAPALPATNFKVGRLAEVPFASGYFDAAICSAVLHFSDDTRAFHNAVTELWRVLAPGGVLFARLASTIGIEKRVTSHGDGRYRLPDGTDRFLVDEETLLNLTGRLDGVLLEPIKTTNVQNLRAMTTWVLGKDQAATTLPDADR